MALAGNLHFPLPHPLSHTQPPHSHSHMQSQSSSTSLQVNGRSSSLSPSLDRKMATGNHIVRVAMSDNDSCMYKSILVSGCTFRKWVLRRIMKWCGGEEVKNAKGLLSDQLATWLLSIQDGYYVAAFPGHALPDFVQIYSMHGWNGLVTRLCSAYSSKPDCYVYVEY